MDFLKRVVKVEKSTRESLNLRRIFGPGSCGEIRALHASGFIEFADAASATRALSMKLDIPGVRVLDLASVHLVNQYRVINPSAFGEGDAMQSNAGAGRVQSDLGGTNRSERPRPDDVLPLPGTSSVPQIGLLQSLKSTNTPISQSSAPPPDPVETRPLLSDAALLPAIPSLILSHSFPSPLPSPATSSSVPPANPFPCIEDHILMRLCGENITLDLRCLAADPATVIELLKVTASERGNWLIVGAYYRRTGNPVGAIAVVTAMLEALKQFNIPEHELKPAFLLLSGCETDLGKLARSNSDPDKVSEHYSNAQQWLQKVYGASTPPLPPPALSADDSKRPRANTPPRAPASLRSRIDTTDAPSAPRSHPTSPNHRMMEREIQSLRDRHQNNANLISDMRVSKRKLEETVEIERDVRRRLQHELDEVKKQREEARRMEVLALAQMKREVDLRRRAEDQADDERELRKRAEDSAEWAILQRTAPYVGMPHVVPMAAPDAFSAFDQHRISF
ncbi:hypothetical protein C8F04DRAFT_1065568 [Mycena alexandri]|uniref:Uncharacterized protein n=1 Tax=Mycena alexandri TaxID=1745969 RepID=A0AAD6TGI2_9AGAR|nr:hypothetical protein C8F04DRAFT_1065568 [Mycena alexandri]